jgi:uncharacterized protein YihD (DUF1040 family)
MRSKKTFKNNRFENTFIKWVDEVKEIYMNSWGKESSKDFNNRLLDLLSHYNTQDNFDKEITKESKDELIFLLKEQTDKIFKEEKEEKIRNTNVLFK